MGILLQERSEQAVQLGDLSFVMDLLNLREGLEQCVQALVGNLGLAFARIWTLNESEKVLELQASAGMYTHTNGAHGRVPLGKFKIGRIAESGA